MSRTTVQRKPTLRPCYQLIQREKQRKLLAETDNRKKSNPLDVLQELLFNEQNINDSTQKSNRSENLITKNKIIYPGKHHFITTTNSAGEVAVDRKHSKIFYPQPRQQLYGVRPTNNVSFISDISKNGRKSNRTASNAYTPPSQLQKLLDHLSSELIDLESITGFNSNKNDFSPNTCSTVLASALITLIGHIKQCTLSLTEKQEINNLKHQLSVVIKNQLDFQEKIEKQMTTMQTMMQTIYQLVNSEVITNKTNGASRICQERTSFEKVQPHQNWLTNAQRPYLIPKDTYNAMDELLLLTRRMNNATPIDPSIYRQSTHDYSNDFHSVNIDSGEASKKLTSPTSVNEINGNSISQQTQQSRNVNQESRSSVTTPISMPSRYSMFELGLLNRKSTTVSPVSLKETLLEKILHERLRLVEQMAELHKQHERTQLDLADLEAKTTQS